VSAFLQAEISNGESINSGDNLISDGAIRHDSVVKNSIIQNERLTLVHSISENGISQISLAEIGKFNITGIDQVSSSQIGSNELSLIQKSSTEVSSTQVGIIKEGLFQTSPTEVSSAEVSSTQVMFGQIGVDKYGTLQVGSSKQSIITPKSIIAEVPLSSSITLQQFFVTNFDVFHNPSPQNKTVPSWTEFLRSSTPFNLKVEITDLPTGQLAEGTITGYDSNGRPNSGTLTIDSNGNNQGWFIDTTPGDNSEFDKQLTSTAYQATNSPATGKYDLLAVILHELGHIQGIIKGNSAFDANVKNNTFIGNGFTATLTADGSHLDNTLYPYDLLNTSLKPGIRKLPSQLYLAIINQLYSNRSKPNPPKPQRRTDSRGIGGDRILRLHHNNWLEPARRHTIDRHHRKPNPNQRRSNSKIQSHCH
jgi:hypothetical protein